jgi:hypothetical protein
MTALKDENISVYVCVYVCHNFVRVSSGGCHRGRELGQREMYSTFFRHRILVPGHTLFYLCLIDPGDERHQTDIKTSIGYSEDPGRVL